MSVIIQVRRDTAANFTTANLILAQGESALELDTGKTKTGNGVLTWINLPYDTSGSGGSGITDGDKGDITVTGSGATWTIDPDVVTYAKIQPVSANSVLANNTAATGDVVEVPLAVNQLFGRGSSGNISPILLGTTMSITGTTLDANANALSGGGYRIGNSVPPTTDDDVVGTIYMDATTGKSYRFTAAQTGVVLSISGDQVTGSNVVKDDGPNNYVATYTGTLQTASSAQQLFNVNTYLSTTGSIVKYPSIQMSNNCRIQGFFRIPTLGSNTMFFGNESYGADGFEMQVVSSNRLWVLRNGTQLFQTTTNFFTTNNTWYYIEMNWIGGVMYIHGGPTTASGGGTTIASAQSTQTGWVFPLGFDMFSRANTQGGLNGYWGQFRLSNGTATAVGTGQIPIPSAPY